MPASSRMSYDEDEDVLWAKQMLAFFATNDTCDTYDTYKDMWMPPLKFISFVEEDNHSYNPYWYNPNLKNPYSRSAHVAELLGLAEWPPSISQSDEAPTEAEILPIVAERPKGHKHKKREKPCPRERVKIQESRIPRISFQRQTNNSRQFANHR